MLFSIHASASCALYAYAVVAAASAGNRSSVATSVTEMFNQPYHRPPALSNPPLHTVLTGLSLPLELPARHDRPRRVEDVLRLQHVLVHRREQQRRARVVEVRNDLVLHARHALPLRVVRIRHHRRPNIRQRSDKDKISCSILYSPIPFEQPKIVCQIYLKLNVFHPFYSVIALINIHSPIFPE